MIYETREKYRKPGPMAEVDRNHPQAKGLRALWLFQEGAGTTVRDIAGTKRHGTTTGIAASNWGLDPKGGHALTFDGSSESVNCGTGFDPTPNGGNLTIAFRCYWAGNNNDYQAIFAKRDSYSASQMRWQISNQKTSLILLFGRASSFVNFDVGLTSGAWQDVVATKDASASTLYKDGVLACPAEASWTQGTDAAALCVISGNQSTPQEEFNGTLSWMAIWDRHFTAAEARALYAEPFAHVIDEPWKRLFSYVPVAAPAGRTTYNTDARPLGVNAGISRWMNRRAS